MRKVGYVLFSEEFDLFEEGRYLISHGCDIVFGDPFGPVSGVFHNFELLMKHIKKDDAIVVRDLSKLGVNSNHIKRIIQELRAQNLHLICLEKNTSTLGHDREQIFQIIELFHDLYSEGVSSSAKKAIADLKLSGRRNGRPTGLTKENLEVARQAVHLRSNLKMKPPEVCERLNISKATFYRYLEYDKLNLLDGDQLLSSPKFKKKRKLRGRALPISSSKKNVIEKAAKMRFVENIQPQVIMKELDISSTFFYNHVNTKRKEFLDIND